MRTIAQIGRRPGISNATRRRDITAVSVVLRWCVAQNWREDNPAASWDRSIIKERRDPIVLPESYDIDYVVAVAPGNFANLIRFAQYTGMREEECASLERSQIDLRRAAINLTKTKTNRPRSVPLDERALGTFAGTPPRLGCSFVFWHPPGDRYMNVASRFVAIVKRAHARAKAEKRPLPRGFRFHDLRHSRRTNRYQRSPLESSIATVEPLNSTAVLSSARKFTYRIDRVKLARRNFCYREERHAHRPVLIQGFQPEAQIRRPHECRSYPNQ
jgi:integrase/recombinase XerD